MNVTVDLWQSEHSPDTGCGTLPLCGSVSGRRTVVGVPGHSATVLSWQVEQAIAVTVLCTIAGAAVPLTFAKIKVLNGAPPWQAVQLAAPKGTWIAGSVLVAGEPESVWPVLWQLAQFREATAVCTIAGGAVPLALVKVKPGGAVKVVFRSEERRVGKESRSRWSPDH